ncbi:MAG: thiosulfate oxidation carrier complex protein SoxZ [Candidatus Parcubacteria bacterium]|nr:thiosulfate oxidation carrier complex protein SoxZ [Burkholderiales bacterium]
MADPMKIRATLKGDLADVRVLMVHPMETGQRKDTSGAIVPVHFIQEVTVRVNGKVMLDGQISQAVSRNPVFSFRLKGVKAGDKLEIAWLDNRGERSQSVTAIA